MAIFGFNLTGRIPIGCLSLLWVAVVVVKAGAESAPPDQAARPNILYVYVDDMGWGSIGPNGQQMRKANSQPYVRTPNIDRLAREGVNFTRAYGCHVCSPARSSQQSGFHQGHTFADRNDPDNAKKAMRRDDVLIGDVLAEVGYATGYWGKWGYGGSKSQSQPVIQNIQTLPTSHGYQHVLAELHHVRAHTFFQPTLWRAPAAPGAVGGLELVANSMNSYQHSDRHPNTPALQNHADYPETAYCDDSYAFAALDFVREQGARFNATGQPFFGLLAFQIPHAPFAEIAVLPQWDQAYADDPAFNSLADQTRQWAAMVTRMDAHVGNLLSALEDPNHDGDTSDSIADRTLVIFQSDNGGPSGHSHRQLDTNGVLRGNKGSIHEGGIRVPLVMRWPQKIHSESKLRAGSGSSMVVDVTDLLPTFCELSGAVTPLGIDGVSIAPTLLDEGHQRRREFVIHEASKGQSIIRGDHKLVRDRGGALQLYHLKSDPAEQVDLADEQPELVRQLEALLLGERVTEPKGFAVTYHRWTGPDGGIASNPDHWSDYQYANAGITYMTDRGAPQLSWVAQISPANEKSSMVRGDRDLEFLGLEVGGSSGEARQSLILGDGLDLVGRNEIRLSPHGVLELNGGGVSSLRWVDIDHEAILRGVGTIDALVYNRGTIRVQADKRRAEKIRPEKHQAGNRLGLELTSDYHESPTAQLELVIADSHDSMLRIAGEARLAGKLSVRLSNGFRPNAGQAYPVLTATTITGKFDQPDDEVVGHDGHRYKIGYRDCEVVLTMQP